MRRAVELGGCPKAADNLLRISELLRDRDTELLPLRPCALVARDGAVLTYSFDRGSPLGLLLVNSRRPGAAIEPTEGGDAHTETFQEVCEVTIATVDAGSQAEARGVPVGGVVVGLNGRPVQGLGHADLTRLIVYESSVTPRPLVLHIRWPLEVRLTAPDNSSSESADEAATKPCDNSPGSATASAGLSYEERPSGHAEIVAPPPPGGGAEFGEACSDSDGDGNGEV